MVKIKQSSIQKRLIAAGARHVKLRSSFKSKDRNGNTITEYADFELPELDADQYTRIETDEHKIVYVGPHGLWCRYRGAPIGGWNGHVNVFANVFGDTQESLRDSVLAFCMDKFYNAVIIGDVIVKPVNFPLCALLDRGSLSITSSTDDDVTAFREGVSNITLDHVIDHWRVPLVYIDQLRDVYSEWATWRKGMLAPGFDDGSFDLDDETDGLSFEGEDQEVIDKLKYNELRFIDYDIDSSSVYLPSVDEIEAVDKIMFNVEQLQDDDDIVFPSRIQDIARAWSEYESVYRPGNGRMGTASR